MKAEDAAIIRRTSTAVETTIGLEVVLMKLDAGECIALGDTGSEVWRLLAEPTAFRPLVDALHLKFEASPGTIEQDVSELITQLEQHGLVELR